ncbi:GNAT family N-acetyltransferase [Aureimonas mangrovi]|uniref:GNAT family N-acetyltransferase n=1 Tax=Aureimonas mangrovi TaxID=2758041 RepID=UPI00163D6B53|nr:GNAT family N-acetyltransferase [Aureimonas mangrovi]
MGEIRALERGDKQNWQKLWQGYQAFYEVSISPEVSEETFERLLAPDEPMHCALAVEDGEPVGLVHYIFHRSTWTRGDYCYLQDLFVDAAVRGRGTGRALIEHVREKAEAAGASRVYWLTQEANHDARALYDKVAERSGFIQYRQVLGT